MLINKKKEKNNMGLVNQEKQYSKKTGIGLLIVLCVFVIAVCSCKIPVDAATKTSIESWCRNQTLAIGKISTIDLQNKKKGASYTFKSSNKKVVSVDKKGKISTLSAGKAKITVTQTLKKKKSKVGTATITVKNASIYSDAKNSYWVSTQTGWISSSDPFCIYESDVIKYINSKAKYSFYSSDKKKLKITTSGKVTYASGSGKVKVTIKETYKKKTRTVGTIQITLKKPTLTKNSLTIPKGGRLCIDKYIKSMGKYLVEVTDTVDKPKDIPEDLKDGEGVNNDEIVEFFYEDDEDDEGFASEGKSLYIKTKSAGVRYLHFYAYDYNEKKFLSSEYIGTIKLTIKEYNNAKKIQTEYEIKDDEDYEDDYELGSCTMWNYTKTPIAIYQQPYNYTGDYTVTSSDETVVTATNIYRRRYGDDDNFEKGFAGLIELYALKPGKATITISANGAKTTLDVTVVSRRFFESCDTYICYAMPFDGKFDPSKLKFESSKSSIARIKPSGYGVNQKDGYVYFDFYLNLRKEGTTDLKVYYDGKTIYDTSIDVYDEDEYGTGDNDDDGYCDWMDVYNYYDE